MEKLYKVTLRSPKNHVTGEYVGFDGDILKSFTVPRNRQLFVKESDLSMIMKFGDGLAEATFMGYIFDKSDVVEAD